MEERRLAHFDTAASKTTKQLIWEHNLFSRFSLWDKVIALTKCCQKIYFIKYTDEIDKFNAFMLISLNTCGTLV